MKLFKFFSFFIVLVAIGVVFYTSYESQQNQSAKDSSAAVESQPYKVGAYYFGTFGPDYPASMLDKLQELYGRRDWWGGVKDFYGQEPGIPQNTQGFSGDFSHLKPVLGYYDLSDVSILEKQIMQAKQNGLSYFNFYWYWNAVEDREFIADGMNSFLKARNTNDLEFMISITAPQGIFSIPKDKESYVIDLIIEKYLKKENYLKAEGRPIIFLLDPSGIGDGSVIQINSFVAALKSKSKSALGVEPYILVNFEVANAKNISSDGYSCLNFYGKPDYYQTYYIDKINSKFNSFSDKPLLPCAMHNFDKRPFHNVFNAESYYFKDFSLSKFTQGLQVTKNYMDSHTSPLSKYVTLYAWNEWYEGGIIEPNVKDKAIYLNTIADVFQLNVGSDPCRITGDCSPFQNSNDSSLKGSFEGIDLDGRLWGWAYDRDDRSKPVNVKIFVDGIELATLTANLQSRNTNENNVYVLENHGFEYRLPQKYLDRKEHTVQVKAINLTDTFGFDEEISMSPRSFMYGRDRRYIENTSTIAGMIESITNDGKITGWTFDTSTPSTSNTAAIYIDGWWETGTFLVEVTTGILRDDINQIYGISGNHGFEFQLPEQYKDGNIHQIYIHGTNLPNTTGYHRLLGLSPKPYSYTVVGNCKSLDSNNDTILDLVDLTSLLSIYKESCASSGSYNSCGSQDTNNDGTISLVDLTYLLSRYKESCNE